MKYRGTRYNSRWDWTTWLIIGLILACCIASYFFNDGIGPTIVSVIMLIFVTVTFLGIYYKIDGNNLIVYNFFYPHVYPINKIREIKPSKSYLSAPATSLTHRLEITFTDRQILKSSLPLVISPVSPNKFIQELVAIRPHLTINVKTGS